MSSITSGVKNSGHTHSHVSSSYSGCRRYIHRGSFFTCCANLLTIPSFAMVFHRNMIRDFPLFIAPIVSCRNFISFLSIISLFRTDSVVSISSSTRRSGRVVPSSSSYDHAPRIFSCVDFAFTLIPFVVSKFVLPELAKSAFFMENGKKSP